MAIRHIISPACVKMVDYDSSGKWIGILLLVTPIYDGWALIGTRAAIRMSMILTISILVRAWWGYSHVKTYRDVSQFWGGFFCKKSVTWIPFFMKKSLTMGLI